MATSRIDSNRGWWEKLLLTVGFLTFAGALLVAYADPATGYELSLYRATPGMFWVGIGAALLIAIGVTFVSSIRLYRSLGLVLVGGSVFAVVALPIVRGYYYYGTADPLTHLGLVKDLAHGRMSPFGMIYPGVHTLSIFISRLTGYPFTRSLLLVVLCFVVVYFLFVPLCVRLLAPEGRVGAVGALSAFLLLPINHVGTHLRVHPFTLTVLFSSLVIFLLLKLFSNRSNLARGIRRNTILVSPVIGYLLVLGVVVTAAVLYHPQQTLNLLILLVCVSGIQTFYRRSHPSHPIADHTITYPLTVFSVGIYALWTFRTSWFYEIATRHLSKVIGYITGDVPIAGERIQSQGASLSAIGASLPMMFFKLFFLSAVYALLTGIVSLLSIRHLSGDNTTEKQSRQLYLALSIVPIVLVFVAYFFGSIRKMQYRHLGFVMLLVTILGAVGLIHIRERLARTFSQPRVSTVFAVCFALMLVLTLAPLYQSPYIHKANQQVTEMQIEGYDSAIDRQTQTVPVMGVRVRPSRYSDATQGVTWTEKRMKSYRETVPTNSLAQLQPTLNGTQYVVVTEMDQQREMIAYDQFRFTRSGFRSLNNQPGVNRIMTNGETNLYYVENESVADSRRSESMEYRHRTRAIETVNNEATDYS